MAEMQSIADLLRSSLVKSSEIASAIDRTGPRIEAMNRRLPSLEAEIRTLARSASLFAIGEHIDRAIGPAAAVLKVYDAAKSIEGSLESEQCSDLLRYLSRVKQLEEALRFLTGNCALVVRWLDDVRMFLEENSVEDDRYVLNINKSLRILGELQATEDRSRFNGGVLFAALNNLEIEFRNLLTDNSFPLPFTTSSPCSDDPPFFPTTVTQKLRAIIERLIPNHRLENCISAYIEVRRANALATLQPFDLEYLEISLSEFDSVQSIEGYIDQWGKHFEFSVRQLFEVEFRLCHDVFGKLNSNIFATIANKSGIHSFIKFGNTITNGKKDAIKLLKLLDIFATLNDLRLDFNRLFGGKACIEIQTQTRELIKKVINGASEIFWDLSTQVQLQRHSSPPADGSVPRLVTFVTDYCNQLLDDDYSFILAQVLEIQIGWNNEKFDELLLVNEVCNVVNEIELNLQIWGKTYEDVTLSYIFLMNNYWYLYNNVMGTKLGDVMGDSWLKGQEQYMEYYASLYLRESWGKLAAVLTDESSEVVLSRRLKEFNEAFDVMYEKQSNWVISDKILRGKTSQIVVQIVVPAYRNFMHLVVEQGLGSGKFVKYSAESLEIMLGSLFQPKLGKYGSRKCTDLMGKIKHVVTSHFSTTPTAAF